MSHDIPEQQTALIVVAHGAEVNGATADLRAAVRRRASDFAEVHLGFIREEPSLDDLWSRLGESSPSDVLITPVFLADGYFAGRLVPERLGIELDEERRFEHGRFRGRYAPPVGTYDAVTELLEGEIVRARARGCSAEAPVVLVGHGTRRAPEVSGATTWHHAERLEARGWSVEVAFIDQDPDLSETASELPLGDLVVLPFLLVDGGHATDDIPELLGFGGRVEKARESHVTVGERRLFYGRSLTSLEGFGALLGR